jgi:hypothetical protein
MITYTYEGQSFEDFLEEQGAEICMGSGTLDDDLQDDVIDWIGQLDVDEVIKWAEFWGRREMIKAQLFQINK